MIPLKHKYNQGSLVLDKKMQNANIYKELVPKVSFDIVLIFIRPKAHGKYKGNARKNKGNWTFFYFLDL